jgi:hypothetical protein
MVAMSVLYAMVPSARVKMIGTAGAEEWGRGSETRAGVKRKEQDRRWLTLGGEELAEKLATGAAARAAVARGDNDSLERLVAGAH